MERRVKLLRDGDGQFVCIPREFEFAGEAAVIRKEGDNLIIEPAPKQSLFEHLATLEPLDREFPEIEDLPPEPSDL